MHRDVHIVHGGENGGMLRAAASDGAVKRARREPVDGRGGRKPRRRVDPDHLPILRPRYGVVRFCDGKLRSAGRKTRFRLRHVGACDLAGGEPVAAGDWGRG